MQLINSTVIRGRELSTIFFSGSLYPGAYIWGSLYPGAYKRVACILSWGLISEVLIYPGACIPTAYIRGLITGAYIRGTFIRELISGGAYSQEANIRGLITGGLYPGLISRGLLSRGLILHTDNF